jgi:hypothetical protein
LGAFALLLRSTNKTSLQSGSQARKIASVQVGGATFKKSATLDLAGENKSVLGKVAVAVPNSGDAAVSWIRRDGGKSEIIFSSVDTDGRILASQVISEGSSDILEYPRMQQSGSEVLVSWAGTSEARGVNTTLIRTQ